MYTIGIFASGGGSNFKAIAQKIAQLNLPITCSFLLTNNSKSGAAQKALDLKIPVHHLSAKTHPKEDERDAEITRIVQESNIDLLVLAGYMKKIPDGVIAALPQRIINIHPSLLPSFGGHGLFGMHVHSAAIEHGAKISGATVHFVNEEYDCGKIIKQQSVPILDDDTPENLAERVLATEHDIYWRVIEAFSKGNVTINNGRVYYSGT
ncbi:MAG: phosphoribosylglycinamide formyltransferase [Fibrobacterales bacterium]